MEQEKDRKGKRRGQEKDRIGKGREKEGHRKETERGARMTERG